MSHSVSWEMLILAREARGLTQAELAEAAAVSQANISKYESGLLSVSEEHLRRIADALDYPETLFYLTERRYGFGSSCTYHRKRQTMPVRELKVLLARLNLRRIQVTRLLNGADIEADNEFLRLDVDEYDGDCEQIARMVRKAWKLPPGPIENLIEAIESAGGLVFIESFGTRKLDAISQWVPGMLPIFFLNADMPGERVRYTAAHELGHLIMHHVPSENMEEEADRFASEFLMPEAEIASDLHSITLARLAQLKAYWKVSIAALARRAKDLGKISPRQYRSLFEQLSKMGYRLAEPLSIPLESPTLVHELIEYHRKAYGYTMPELSLLLGLPEHEVAAQYGLDAPSVHLVPKRHGKQSRTG